MTLSRSESVRVFVDSIAARGIDALVARANGHWFVDESTPDWPIADFTHKPYGGECYLFRPSVLFSDYACDEARRNLSKTESLLCSALRPLARTLVSQSGWDAQVQMNALGFSTQIVADRSSESINSLALSLQDRFDGLPVFLRSVNERMLPSLFSMPNIVRIPTRQVWLWENPPSSRKKSKDYWEDIKLLSRSNWSWLSGSLWQQSDFRKSVFLYEDLYLRKYTTFNPQYTEEGFRLYQSSGLVDFLGLLDPEGSMVGFLGTFEADGWMTLPFIGVDQSRPKEDAIYRMLCAKGFEEAQRRNLKMHLSAGAARFKELRGARPFLEYSFLWPGQTSARRRFPTFLTRKILDGISPSIMASRF